MNERSLLLEELRKGVAEDVGGEDFMPGGNVQRQNGRGGCRARVAEGVRG